MEEDEVSGVDSQGVLAITSSAKRFLATQKIFPPKTELAEIDPSDHNYSEKMESACTQLRAQLLQEVPMAFADHLEAQNVANFPPVRISVREDMDPVKVYSARPFPLGREQKCKEIIKNLVTAGTIAEFHGESEWVSPAFFVRKGAADCRMVCDLRRLNLATNRYGWPGQNTETVFHQMEHSA